MVILVLEQYTTIFDYVAIRIRYTTVFSTKKSVQLLREISPKAISSKERFAEK
uniref:Uncharacterized protein n=1 Tax=Rhizophagus irregularis (strain DAOM 181602 / DAOM 197198 / MUCL 43194) TaxID=747089 RepID=U9T9B0_RHIID